MQRREGRIQVNTALIRDVARQFENARQEGERMEASLYGLVNSLQVQWEGVRARRFSDQYAQWRDEMRRLLNSLNDVARELHDIASRFEAADR